VHIEKKRSPATRESTTWLKIPVTWLSSGQSQIFAVYRRLKGNPQLTNAAILTPSPSRTHRKYQTVLSVLSNSKDHLSPSPSPCHPQQCQSAPRSHSIMRSRTNPFCREPPSAAITLPRVPAETREIHRITTHTKLQLFPSVRRVMIQIARRVKESERRRWRTMLSCASMPRMRVNWTQMFEMSSRESSH
jgi:hypothetical protein